MKNNKAERYPYLQVITMFTGLSSIIGGLLVQLILLIIFREANFAQIGLHPLLHVGLLGLIPALLAGMVIANKQIWQGDAHSTRTVFLIGFVISALYIAAIIIYLGIGSVEEVGILSVAMLTIGLFGGVNLVIASLAALPKACTTRFDNPVKKGDDIYQDFITLDNQSVE
ncbi:hypothetical protein [Psychrobacter sp. M13]|uniref:hypothetical protein n=1 Tax=Psychrobacter sp. M13 TaxID=3067275 RepID=UPI00273B1855|nr:hypothetical protein [Psychrobacter sp. M13]WLP94528.1 hypothetical protein Q9G97_13325 [Psychrobacter sp. M13]